MVLDTPNLAQINFSVLGTFRGRPSEENILYYWHCQYLKYYRHGRKLSVADTCGGNSLGESCEAKQHNSPTNPRIRIGWWIISISSIGSASSRWAWCQQMKQYLSNMSFHQAITFGGWCFQLGAIRQNNQRIFEGTAPIVDELSKGI